MARLAARWLPLAALLLLAAGLALRPMAESDLFFHLKAGEEIWRRHELPGRNLFSFTYPDYPDLDTSWLAEVGGAAVFRFGGFPGVVVAKALVLLAAFAGAYVVCRRWGAGPCASALALMAAALVGRDRFVERPHVFSLLGEAATLAAIGALARRRGMAAARWAAGFVLVVVLWANLHAGVFVAPVLLGAAAVGAVLGRDAAFGRRLALAAIGAALATLATPVGLGLVRYLQLHLQLPALHPVDEFRRPSWVSDAPLFAYAAVFICAAGFLSATRGGGGRPERLSIVVPAFALLLLCARAVRFGADFALVAAPPLALAATALTDRLRAWFPGPAAIASAPHAGVVLAALSLGFTIVPRMATGSGWRERIGIGLDARELPLEAIAFANDHGLRDRMYNDFEIGSYLLFEPVGGYPRHQVFVDPRLPAYPPEMHRLLGRADLSRQEWGRAMDRYGVDSALLAYAGVNRRLSWWDPDRWALVFRGGDARIFVRRVPRFQALIASDEIPATFAFSPAEGNATVPLEVRPAASPVADCEWSRRLGDLMIELDGVLSARARAAYDRALAAAPGCLARPDEARLAAWMGAVELGERRSAEALALVQRALGAGDRELTTFVDRAEALEALGRRPEAAAAWDEAAARAGDSPLARRARAHAARLRN